jgi:hypothetical protein
VTAIDTADTGIFIIDVNFSFAMGTVVRQRNHLLFGQKTDIYFSKDGENSKLYKSNTVNGNQRQRKNKKRNRNRKIPASYSSSSSSKKS